MNFTLCPKYQNLRIKSEFTIVVQKFEGSKSKIYADHSKYNAVKNKTKHKKTYYREVHNLVMPIITNSFEPLVNDLAMQKARNAKAGTRGCWDFGMASTLRSMEGAGGAVERESKPPPSQCLYGNLMGGGGREGWDPI